MPNLLIEMIICRPILCLCLITTITSGGGLSFSGARAQNLTFLPPPAIQQGAVCLDGSPPAYQLDRGHGSGNNSWIVHLEGGGWCPSVENCMMRTTTDRGSSLLMTPDIFGGHLSNSSIKNPGFFNWNRVLVRYCDGASFSGNVNEHVVVTLARNETKKLFFRGQRIWEAIMEDLTNNQAMGLADQAILSGDSAGGLATFFHCNDFKSRFPSNVTVKCLSDGGFFMDLPSITGENFIRPFYQNVTSLHNVTILPQACLKVRSMGECFFPQYNLDSIHAPMFFLQSSYDSWQLQNIIAPSQADPSHEWSACTMSLANCTLSQLSIVQDFRRTLIERLAPLKGHQGWGMHIVSCLYHTQENLDSLWNGLVKVDNMTPSMAFSMWYFNNELVQNVDCEYPCNPTCQ